MSRVRMKKIKAVIVLLLALLLAMPNVMAVQAAGPPQLEVVVSNSVIYVSTYSDHLSKAGNSLILKVPVGLTLARIRGESGTVYSNVTIVVEGTNQTLDLENVKIEAAPGRPGIDYGASGGRYWWWL